MGFHRSGWPLVGHLRVVLSAGSAAGCIPRKEEPVALGPCPFGPSLSACFGLSVLTTVQKHIRVPTHSNVAHRIPPSGSASSCFAPLARPMRPGVKRQHEGGAVTSASLGWELDISPHPHVHPVIKGSNAAFASHPLGFLQVSRERVAAPSEPGVHLSKHHALHPTHSKTSYQEEYQHEACHDMEHIEQLSFCAFVPFSALCQAAYF